MVIVMPSYRPYYQIFYFVFVSASYYWASEIPLGIAWMFLMFGRCNTRIGCFFDIMDECFHGTNVPVYTVFIQRLK
jgi:hypothetical protein